MTTVGSGQTSAISSGQLSSGWVVESGGTLSVLAGGSAISATINGGFEVVSASGEDDFAQLSGGEQDVFGFANSVTVFSGLQLVEAGGTVANTILSGGTEIVSAGGVDLGGAQILAGVQEVFGQIYFDTVFIGAEVVESGGTANGTYIFGGGGGSEIVSAGGTEIGAQILGGELDVFGQASGVTLFFGSQIVESGGTASGTIISGGMEIVSSGGLGLAAQILGGGDLFANSAVELVSAGGTDVGTLISGGEQDLFGRADGVTVFSGLQLIEAGATASGTILSGGTETVSAGGTDLGAQVSAGEQDVFGLAGGATVFSGVQLIEAGAAASGTMLSGGMEIVSAGATDLAAQISEGEQDVFGLASGAAVFAGLQVVEAGGTAHGTTIEFPGSAIVSNGGAVSGNTFVAGGTLVLSAGALVGGPVTLFDGGLLAVENPSVLSGLVVGGFDLGDTIDLATIAFDSGGTITPVGSALHIVESGQSYVVQFAANIAAEKFLLTSDDTSGTDITLSSPFAISAGQTAAITAGETSTGVEVLSGGFLEVLSGGTAVDALLDAGTELVSAGGVDSSAQIIRGGVEDVMSGGTAGGVAIVGGAQIVESGGAASDTMLSGGTANVLGTETGATVAGFGLEIVAGSDSGALIDGGVQAVSGYASGATVVAGSQIVETGGTASGTMLSGGTEVVAAGGTDVGAQICGGEQDVFGSASDTTIFAGTQMVESGGNAIGSIYGGLEIVLAGGTDLGTQLFSGSETVFGLGQFQTLWSGLQVVETGGSMVLDGIFGGTEIVDAGGDDAFGGLFGGEQIVSGLATDGTLFGGSQFVGPGGTAINTTVDSGAAEIVLSGGAVSGTIVSSGGTLELLAGFTGSGITVSAGGTEEIEVGSGSIASGYVISSGIVIAVASGGTLADATVLSGGVVVLLSGAVTSGTETLSAGGTISVAGLVNNQSGTISVGPGELDLVAQSLNTIVGGTIVDDGSGIIGGGGTLVGATLEGTLTFGNINHEPPIIDIAGGLTLLGPGGTGSAVLNNSGQLVFIDSEIVNNAVVNDGGEISDDAGVLTLGPDLTINASAGSFNGVESSGDGIVNEGIINITNFDIGGENLTNSGAINVASGELDALPLSFTNAPGGTVSISGGATLSIDSIQLLDSQGDFVFGQWSNQGQITAASSGTVDLDGDWLNQGQITIGPDSTVALGEMLTVGSGGTNTWSNQGTITIGSGSTVDIGGTWSNQGTLRIGSGSTVDLTGTVTVAQLESIAANSGVSIDVGGTLALTGQSLTIGSNTLTVGSSALLDPVSFNFESSKISGTGTISGPINNNTTDLGEIEASGGTLVVNGPVGPGGFTSFLIDANSNLVIGAAANSEYAFDGANGTLTLDAPSSFSGTLAGLAPSDLIDLANTAVTDATISGSTLAITENNGTVLSYALAAPLTGDTVQLATDGAGGTDLIIEVGTPYAAFDNAADTLAVDVDSANSSAGQILGDAINVYTTAVAGAIGTLGGSNWEVAYDNSWAAASMVASGLSGGASDQQLLSATLGLYDTIVGGVVGSVASGASAAAYGTILGAAGTLGTDILDGANSSTLLSNIASLYTAIDGGAVTSAWQQAQNASDQAASALSADLTSGASGAQIESDVATLYDSLVSGSLNAIGGSALQQAYGSGGETIGTLAADIAGGAPAIQLQGDVAGLYNAVIGGVDGSATPLAVQAYQTVLETDDLLASDIASGAGGGQLWYDTAGIIAAAQSGELGASEGATAQQTYNNYLSAMTELQTDGLNGIPPLQTIDDLGTAAEADVIGVIAGPLSQAAFTSASNAAESLASDIGGGGSGTQILGDVLAVFSEGIGEFSVANGGASSSGYAAIVGAANALNSDIEGGNASAIAGDVAALIAASQAGDLDTTDADAWQQLVGTVQQPISTLVADMNSGAGADQIMEDAGSLYDTLVTGSNEATGSQDTQLASVGELPSDLVNDVVDGFDDDSVLSDALLLVNELADPCGPLMEEITPYEQVINAGGRLDTITSLAGKINQNAPPGLLDELATAIKETATELQGEAAIAAYDGAEAAAAEAAEAAALAGATATGAEALVPVLTAIGAADLAIELAIATAKNGNAQLQDFFNNNPIGRSLAWFHQFIAPFANPFNLFNPGQYLKLVANLIQPAWGPNELPVAKAHDDVHLETYDGLLYDFQAAGEFILTQSTKPGDSFEVQARLQPWNGGNPSVSVMTMIGAQVGTDRVTFAIDRTNTVWIDGNPVSLALNTPVYLNGGELAEIAPSTFQLNWNTGESITVTNLESWLNVSVSISLADGPGTVQGLLGPDEGQANDFQLPNGTVLQQPLSSAELYGEYANAWRVTPSNSLLDNAQGQTTATFTDVNFPSDALTLADLPQSVVSAAAQAVAAAGITDPNLAADAELDYIATGDPDFIAGDAAAQIPGGTVSAVVTQSTSPAALLGVIASSSIVVESAGASTPVSFEVYLTNAASAATIVDYTVVSGGSGFFDPSTLGSASSGTITISSGGTVADITIDLPTSALGTQPSETLEVQIASPNGPSILGATAETLVANSQPEPGNAAIPVLEDLTNLGTFTQSGSAYTLDLGTLPVGDMPQLDFGIVNAASAPADELTGSFAVAGGGVVFSGDTNFAAIEPGQVYTGLQATLDTGNLGSNSETITFTPEELNASTFSATLAPITLTIDYLVDVSANAVVNSPTTVNFGNVRTGTAQSQSVSITNSANAGAAGLDASLSLFGAATGSGAITQLAAGATDDTGLSVGLNTSAGGLGAGIATINFYSDGGTGNTEFISSEAINVLGSVFRPGSASVAAIIAHVGDPTSQALVIGNGDPADGFSENLIAAVVSSTGGVTISGGTTGEIAPQATNSSFTLGYSTASVGTVGTFTLDFTTDGGTGSGSIDGLGTQDLGDQTYSVTVDNYAQAAFVEVAGGGTLTHSGNAYTLDLGNVAGGRPVTLDLGVVNGAAGPADLLSGTLAVSGNSAFANSGFAAFSSLGAGEVNSGLTVSLDTSSGGNFSETITLDPTDYNAAGYSSGLAPLTFTISADVSGGIVGSGNVVTIASGETSVGLDIQSGGTVLVLSGGTASATTIESDGIEVVSGGGIDRGAQISGGTQLDYGLVTGAALLTGSQVIESGGTASNTTVSNGGLLIVSSGGLADPPTILGGGSETISLGGTDRGTRISGGEQVVYGLASAAILAAGSQVVESGGTATSTTVASGGVLDVLSGGKAIAPHLLSGATDVIGGTVSGFVVSSGVTLEVSGGVASNTTVLRGGTLELVAGARLTGTTKVSSGGIVEVGSGSTLSGYAVSGGVTLEAAFSGTVSSASVAANGKLFVESGGIATSTTVKTGGLEVVSGGGTASGVTVSNGGTFEWVGSDAVATGLSLRTGAVVEVGSGFTLSGNTFSAGIAWKVLAGGIASGGAILSGGTLNVLSGGEASGTTVGSGGRLIVSSGGLGEGVTVDSRGTAIVAPHGSDVGLTISAGGTAIVSSGGAVELVGGNTGSGLTVLAGGALDAGSGFTLSSFSAGKGVTVEVLSGGSTTSTVSIGNGGTLEFLGGGTGSFKLGSGATLVVGSGYTLSNFTVSKGIAEQILGGGTSLNATVSSGGTIDGIGLIAGQLTVSSGGTVNANNGFDLVISTESAAINAGKVEATGGGVLFIDSDVVNSGTVLASGVNTFAGIGITDGATVSNTSTGLVLVSGANEVIEFLGGTILGGKLQATKNALVLVNAGANAISGATIVSGSLVQVNNSGTTLTANNVSMGAGAVLEAFSGAALAASNVSMGADAVLAAVTGATLTMSGGTIGVGDAVGALGGTATIIGSVINSGSLQALALGPTLVVLGGTLINTTKGTISGSGGSAVVELDGATVSGGKWQMVAGALVETASGTANLISGATIVSGSVIEVTDGGELTLSGTIANAGTIEVSAATSAATLALSGATLSGGKLATSGASALIETVSGTVDTIHGGTIVSGSDLAVISASALILSGGTAGAGATVSAVSGSTLIVSGTLADSGTLDLSGVTSVAAHATLAVLSGGSAIVTGTVVNSGTFTASALGSLIEIESGGTVSGGAVTVGNGIVDVLSGGSANVAFQATGSGALEIDDSVNNTSAFTGKVSGFGGAGHANHKQFIDLTSVTFESGQIHLHYAASGGSGTLTVSSGTTVVAQITIVGTYTSANFSAGADSQGNVKIFDPVVPNGGSVEPGTAFPQQGVDLPNIAFGAQTTLAYAENAAGTGGTLTVSDGRHAAAIALLGNYMAGSFVTTADGHGGTLVTEASQTGQQMLLAQPRHG